MLRLAFSFTITHFKIIKNKINFRLYLIVVCSLYVSTINITKLQSVLIKRITKMLNL